MRPAGFIIDVPVTLSVAVRGVPLETAKRIAREFADRLSPTGDYCDGYTKGLTERRDAPGYAGALITEATLESNREDACEVLEELEPDDVDEEDEPRDAGR
jgi:hypothetical protein